MIKNYLIDDKTIITEILVCKTIHSSQGNILTIQYNENIEDYLNESENLVVLATNLDSITESLHCTKYYNIKMLENPEQFQFKAVSYTHLTLPTNREV